MPFTYHENNMYKHCSFIKIKTLITFSVLITVVQNMRYDIDEEALKLYGEDLQTVVKRFRRTPEYLKILKDKYEDLQDLRQDALDLLVYHYRTQMDADAAAKYPMPEDNNTSTTLGDPTFLRGPGYFVNKYRYNPFHADKTRRDEDDGSTMTPVEHLDSYPLLASALSVQERNAWKDIGFNYAGQMIHAWIKSMGSDDLSKKSTKFVMDGHKPPSTTVEHTHDVQSTKHHHEEVTHEPEVATDETFVYKHRAPNSGVQRKFPSKFG